MGAAAGSVVTGYIVTRGENGELLHYANVGIIAVVASFIGMLLASKIRMVE